MGLFSFIGSIFIIVISVNIAVLISQPFSGSLVRLRANYLPKAVSLDDVLEDGAMEGPGEEQAFGFEPGQGRGGLSGVTPRKISAYFLSQRRQSAKIGPVVSGIFPMLFRTKRLEGWSGVYKGSIPVALQLIVLAFATSILFDVDGHSTVGAGGSYKAAPTGPGQFGFFTNLFFMIIGALVALPLEVLTCRTIVHPRVLTPDLASIRSNLNELFSPAEVAQPWRIYLIPGLLPTTFAHICWVGILTRLVRHILVPNLGGLAEPTPAAPGDTTYSSPSSVEVNPLALVIFLLWCAFSVVALSPLEVVSVRLATQRPEKQQPLHLAYAHLGNGNSNAPASYSHQASVPRSDGAFADEVPATDKPLPSQPESAEAENAPGRPSFAIEDEDEDAPESRGANGGEDAQDPLIEGNGGEGQQQTGSRTSSEQGRGAAAGGGAQRHLGGQSIPAPPPPHLRNSSSSYHHHHSGGGYDEPAEPVIALRPVEEPSSTSQQQSSSGGQGIEEQAVQRYEGLKDCLDKIVEEEGVEALYRGAWVTGIGALLGAFN
ncbi:hypothetical protein BCV69DRAFT_276425 [Microstroma glucosiphilum]|uniref:Mitochondrial carrier n=1 Tax=Pseudomicrostroma glucosiphilum TaxID=1684307 RepID=A0A316UCB2_9BASI|nr:hypothetical protein BCV69DRAFT_276425 [Pseudomicrostroma glucosiphilum]PWN22508.1 hypothetical protein BCV69DRAFT_276425 [Pseudomicrostroma glucosiphilum]